MLRKPYNHDDPRLLRTLDFCIDARLHSDFSLSGDDITSFTDPVKGRAYTPIDATKKPQLQEDSDGLPYVLIDHNHYALISNQILIDDAEVFVVVDLKTDTYNPELDNCVFSTGTDINYGHGDDQYLTRREGDYKWAPWQLAGAVGGRPVKLFGTSVTSSYQKYFLYARREWSNDSSGTIEAFEGSVSSGGVSDGFNQTNVRTSRNARSAIGCKVQDGSPNAAHSKFFGRLRAIYIFNDLLSADDRTRQMKRLSNEWGLGL